jgi:hypothetical protein
MKSFPQFGLFTVFLCGERVFLFLCLEGSISVIENKSKEAAATEMGVGLRTPFWVEVGDDRNEGKRV